MSGLTAVAVLSAVAMTVMAQPASAQKKVKDQGEYDLINVEIAKDVQGQNWAKMQADLDAWKQKYPESDWKNDREAMYVQAYLMQKQYDKTLDKAKELMDKGLDATYNDPKEGPQQIVKVLLQACQAVGALLQTHQATPDQLKIGDKAAHDLLAFSRAPEGIPAAAWTDAKKQLDGIAKQTALAIALEPANLAAAKKDCAGQEAGYAAALGAYPDNTFISNGLAAAYRCQKKELQALYEYVRSATLDPTLAGGAPDPKKVTDFAKNYYIHYHGGEDGYAQFQEMTKQNPMPPADLKLETQMEVLTRQQAEFEKTHPDIALWIKLKTTLTSPEGQQYFDSGMKGAAVPELKGTVLEGKCRAKELLVGVPMPDATGTPTAEITIKLETPLTGKPEAGQITFTGVATEFTTQPTFMLTMTANPKTDVHDLKVTPCAAPAGRKGAPAPKKKG